MSSSILTKSTLFAAIGRSTATKAIYVPASCLHMSSVFYRESVIDKAKHVADSLNKGVGKKISNVIDKVEHVAHKTEHLKENATQHVASVNRDFGNKVSHVLDEAEEVTTQKAQELKKDAKNTAENFKKKAPAEKTIIETVKDSVKTVENIVEKTKEAVGLGAKKATHSADELKDEAKLGVKKAANYVDETREKAAKDIKNKY